MRVNTFYRGKGQQKFKYYQQVQPLLGQIGLFFGQYFQPEQPDCPLEAIFGLTYSFADENYPNSQMVLGYKTSE